MDHRRMSRVLNERLLRQTASGRIACTERQLQPYGYMARVSEADPAQRIVSVRNSPEWRRLKGRPQISLPEQVNRSCHELLRMGRGPKGDLAEGIL